MAIVSAQPWSSLNVKLKSHPFHIVNPSPWPFLVSLNVFGMLLASVAYFHKEISSSICLFGLFSVVFAIFCWFRDIIFEGTYLGHHTLAVQKGLRYGFLLFIASEVMFFVSFFWGFFHSSLSPSIWIGSIWPPLGIICLNPGTVPLLNTFILLLSGATVTLAHMALLKGSRYLTTMALTLTVALGLFFSSIQCFEYVYGTLFNISDSIYGSLFYMMTGFHGLHVFIGTIFLFVCLIRLYYFHFTKEHHLGFEFAAWYWHFVDIVWLFLYAFVYVWSSLGNS